MCYNTIYIPKEAVINNKMNQNSFTHVATLTGSIQIQENSLGRSVYIGSRT